MERWIHNARMFSARGGLITSVVRVPEKHFQLLSSNTTMDTQTLADAAAYARIKAANLAYYHAHAAEIAAKVTMSEIRAFFVLLESDTSVAIRT